MEKRLSAVWIAALAMLAAGTTVLAGVGVTAKLGTLGYGGELTVGMAQQFNVRVGFNVFDYDFDENFFDDDDDDDVDEIQVALDLQTIALLLDWHPAGDGLRFTAGAVLNDNEVGLSADANDIVDIGDGEYRIGTLAGEVTVNDISPYIGVGYGNAAGGGHWHFAIDVGLLYQGSPDVTLDASALDPALQPLLEEDVAREIEDVEDDIDSFSFYPVVAIGLSYRF